MLGAARQSEKEKENIYENTNKYITYYPAVMETYGGMDERFEALIQHMTRLAREHLTTRDPIEFMDELRDRLAVDLVKRMAVIIRLQRVDRR